MTPQRWILLLSMFALAVSSAALWDAMRPVPGTVADLERKVTEQREAGTPVGATETDTLLTVSGGDQPTFGTLGNNNLVFSSSWTGKTWITIGPYDVAANGSVAPPTWVRFHQELPSDTMIKVDGYGDVSLGLLRSWAKRER